jgi:hypothetical protein
MKLTVFGHTYQVKIQKIDDAAFVDYDSKTITINPDEDFISCLLHEGFHAVLRRTGIHQAQLSDDLEEIIVENFAIFLVENFKIQLKSKGGKKNISHS